MTDGERQKIREAMHLFAQAGVRSRGNENSSQFLAYNTACLALNWVMVLLNDPQGSQQLFALFESLLNEVKGFGLTYDPNLN